MSSLTFAIEQTVEHQQTHVPTLMDLPVGRQKVLEGFFDGTSVALAHPSECAAVRSAMFHKHLAKMDEE